MGCEVTSACHAVAVGVGPSQVPLSGTTRPDKALSTAPDPQLIHHHRRPLVLSQLFYRFCHTRDKMPPKAAQPREFIHPEASHARKM